MPTYAVPATASLEKLIEHATAVAAGLQAMPELAPLAPAWAEIRTRLRQARDARDEDNDAVIAASARVRVLDAQWDDAVVELSGVAYLAAGKDAKASPYAPLFGAVRAADAVKLGAGREAAFGAQLVRKARELGKAELAGPTDRIAALNDALAGAASARTEVSNAAALNAIKRGKLVDELNALVATTEVGVLTAFPGRRELTRAVLSPYREARRRDTSDDGATETADE